MNRGAAANTSSNREAGELKIRIDSLHSKNPNGASLYFVFSDGKSPEIVSLPIPHESDSDRFDLPKTLTLRPATSGRTKVFNRTDHREGTTPAGEYSSIYFMPYTTKEFKNIHPRSDFDEATNIGPGCGVINLKGASTLSLAYGKISKYADNIVSLNQKSHSAENEKRIAGEVNSLKLKGVGTGSGRSPASTAGPTYADDRDPKIEKRTRKNLSENGTAMKPKKTTRSGSGN
jgi:hypothetical protein